MDQNLETYLNQIVRELNCSEIEKNEIAEEMRDHLQLLKNEYIGQGFSDEEATEKALQSFGDNRNIKKGLQSSLFPYYKIFRFGIWSLFSLYSFILLWSLLLMRMIDRIIDHGSFNGYFRYTEDANSFFNIEVWRLNSNLIPFHSTYEYMIGIDRFNLDIILHNTIGNILIFVPLGIFLPILLKKYHKFSKIFLIGFVISFAVEVLQFSLQIGQFDIDDIILNTLGTIVGFSLFKFLIQISNLTKWNIVQKITN
ncbi:VanZ family protein [Bacillus sp. CGMCC 1.16607]|uniref:VanZ family protein n=1 Tax=Bacillus sp. CGMCC 1.16607 TaxID=3351842 RepID=UPI0036284DCA